MIIKYSDKWIQVFIFKMFINYFTGKKRNRAISEERRREEGEGERRAGGGGKEEGKEEEGRGMEEGNSYNNPLDQKIFDIKKTQKSRRIKKKNLQETSFETQSKKSRNVKLYFINLIINTTL